MPLSYIIYGSVAVMAITILIYIFSKKARQHKSDDNS